MKPSLTPKSLGKRPSNEGHGFSRAINGPRLTALASEVRFSRHTGEVMPFAAEFAV
jgi:hypothetical protein